MIFAYFIGGPSDLQKRNLATAPAGGRFYFAKLDPVFSEWEGGVLSVQAVQSYVYEVEARWREGLDEVWVMRYIGIE